VKDTISKAFIALMVPVAGWVGASEPMVWATPQAGQPALALRVEPASSLAGSRIDQAQGQ
jgi:hypothetical protein